MRASARGLSALLLSSACCVAADTRVETPQGARSIGALAPGDRVWSVDVAGGRREAATVVALRRARRECVALRWEGGELVCTPDHPVFDPELGDYRPARDWVRGAARQVLRCDDVALAVEVVEVRAEVGEREVVDITLAEGPHNFIAAGVVVHNKSYGYPSAEASLDGGVELSAEVRERSFLFRVCVDGEDPMDAQFEMAIAAGPIPTTESDGSLRLGVIAELPSGRTIFQDFTVPGSTHFYSLEYEAQPCGVGFRVRLVRLDAREDAGVYVTFNANASTEEVEADDELEFTVEEDE